jgi:hypothetical protein
VELEILSSKKVLAFSQSPLYRGTFLAPCPQDHRISTTKFHGDDYQNISTSDLDLDCCSRPIKILGSERQTSGTYAKTAKLATKKDNAAACLCFLSYLAVLRPAADRTVSVLPWVVRLGRSYGFLWAGSISQKNERKDDPTPAYLPVSALTVLALCCAQWTSTSAVRFTLNTPGKQAGVLFRIAELKIKGRTLKKELFSLKRKKKAAKWREISVGRNQRHTVCGSEGPSATIETPTSFRQGTLA